MTNFSENREPFDQIIHMKAMYTNSLAVLGLFSLPFIASPQAELEKFSFLSLKFASVFLREIIFGRI